MINDLDETIKQLLIIKGALEPAEIDVSFDAPDREWSASVNKPTINIYLYDIRENHQLRGTEWIVTRDQDGNVTKKKNAKRIDVSYLITVWANDAADEHDDQAQACRQYHTRQGGAHEIPSTRSGHGLTVPAAPRGTR